MDRTLLRTMAAIAASTGLVVALAAFGASSGSSGGESLAIAAVDSFALDRWEIDETSPELDEPWERPAGPIRIGLQAGHWRASEAPDEQAGLRTNGTRGGGKAEWEVNLAIARRTATLLEKAGFVVDILPTTIPPQYLADLFISIHADGSPSASASGYRAAAPRRDRTGQAAGFAELLSSVYGEATGLPRYPTLTRRMTSYYAFNYRRYEHALHPRTVGVILETGFLTSPRDRQVIVSAPDRAARGIADAVVRYFEKSGVAAEQP